jgi:hypothetical protein
MLGALDLQQNATTMGGGRGADRRRQAQACAHAHMRRCAHDHAGRGRHGGVNANRKYTQTAEARTVTHRHGQTQADTGARPDRWRRAVNRVLYVGAAHTHTHTHTETSAYVARKRGVSEPMKRDVRACVLCWMARHTTICRRARAFEQAHLLVLALNLFIA